MKKRLLLLSLAGAFALAEASAGDIVLCDFEANAIGDAYNMKNLYSPTTTSTAVVEADPANPQNKVLHVKNTEWNTFVEYALPDGVTGANLYDKYQTITFDIYRPAPSDGNDWMQAAILLGTDQLYWDADYPYQGDRGVWLTKTYDLKEVRNDATVLLVGYNNDKAEYYIDNIRLSGVVKQATDTLRWTGATSDVWANGGDANFARLADDVATAEPLSFANGNSVVFDDTVKAAPASGNVSVRVRGTVEAPGISFAGKELDYTLSAFNDADNPAAITGYGRMEVTGGRTVTTSVENRMNGGTYIKDGTLRMGSRDVASPFGTQVAVERGALHFSLNNTASSYVELGAPIAIADGGTLDAYTSRYTYWMSPLSGSGTLNIHAGGERSYLGNAKGAQYPDWSAFTGTVNVYPYKEVIGSAGFYGLVLGHGSGSFNVEDAVEDVESATANTMFANKTLVLHDGTTLACESGTRGFRIGELRTAPTSRICGYYKTSSTPRSYYLVGRLGTDSELAGQIAPPDGADEQQVGLLKEGAGTYTLTNNNNLINGGIRVLGGTLLVNNDAEAAASAKLSGGTGYTTDGSTQTFVFTGGTIGGSGNIAGSTDVYGTLEPGDRGIGTLTLANYAKGTPVSLYLRPTTVVNIEVGAGGAHDSIYVSGDLIYYNICEDFTESDAKPKLRIDVKDTYEYREGDEFVLIEAAGKGSLYGDPWAFDVELPDAAKWAVEEQETAEGYRLVLKTNTPDAITAAQASPQAGIYAEAGRVCVSAEAGTAIRIYSADGRLLREAVAHSGLNAFGGLEGMVIVSAGATTKKITVKQ